MKKTLTGAALAAALILSGCSAADVASQNVSNDADNFKVDRRIVAINLITNEYLFEVTGKCSITPDTKDSQLEIICKVGPNAYTKSFVGYTAGSNVVYTVEQLETTNADEYHYKLNFRPSVIVPTVVG